MSDNIDNSPIYIEGSEIPIQTSIIDYLEPMNGGVPISVCITIYHFTFQGIYFIHPLGSCYLELEPDFLKLWGSVNTITLPFYEELCKDIDFILPNKELIFKELL